MPLSTGPRRNAAAVTAALLGAAGTVFAAAPAWAHTPSWAVTCSEVQVDLTGYQDQAPNEVTVTVDGKDLLPTERFGREFHKKLPLPDHDKELTVRLVVKASDGDQFSRDETRTAPVCEDSTPAPTPSTTPPTSPPATPTATPGETPPTETSPAPPTETSPAPSAPAPGGGDLAETGSSGATPVIGGAAVAVVLAGGGILWAVRKRRATGG